MLQQVYLDNLTRQIQDENFLSNTTGVHTNETSDDSIFTIQPIDITNPIIQIRDLQAAHRELTAKLNDILDHVYGQDKDWLHFKPMLQKHTDLMIYLSSASTKSTSITTC